MKERDKGPHRHTCQQLVELLCDYLEGDLDTEEGRELERHLSDCPPCHAFTNTYRKTTEICRSLRPEDIPSHLKERLEQILARSVTGGD